VPNFGGGGGI